MARSLTISHDEAPATSPLFTGFLLIAVLSLLASSVFGPGPIGSASADASPDQPIYAE